MTNWKTYVIQDRSTFGSDPKWVRFELDGYVNFKVGETKDFIYCENRSPFNSWGVGYRIEIDNDRTKNRNCTENVESTTIVRLSSSSSMTAIHSAMINASSVNANALATTCEMLNRVDRGEQTQFTYQIEDKGVKHSWIYKRN